MKSSAMPFPLRRFLTDFAYATILNVLCALVITFMGSTVGKFLPNLVYSMCIGTIAFIIIDGMRLALWNDTPEQRPKWLPFLVLVLVAVTIAQYGGSFLAGSLLGLKMSAMVPGSPRMTSMLIFTLSAAGVATLFFASRERLMRAEAQVAQEKARAEAIARQALQAQLQLLQAQIEPHRLFNTLANLQGLISLDPERAQRMLDQLIQYLRATLSSSRAQSTTLGQEFSLMEAYLGLMSVRMGQRLSYALHLPDALRAASVPPMLLQPLIENAIQHGLEPKVDGGHIEVVAAMDKGMLLLHVSDSGLGRVHGAGTSGTGLGLTNMRERLLALYGDLASVSLADGATAGTVAHLSLPMSLT